MFYCWQATSTSQLGSFWPAPFFKPPKTNLFGGDATLRNSWYTMDSQKFLKMATTGYNYQLSIFHLCSTVYVYAIIYTLLFFWVNKGIPRWSVFFSNGKRSRAPRHEGPAASSAVWRWPARWPERSPERSSFWLEGNWSKSLRFGIVQTQTSKKKHPIYIYKITHLKPSIKIPGKLKADCFKPRRRLAGSKPCWQMNQPPAWSAEGGAKEWADEMAIRFVCVFLYCMFLFICIHLFAFHNFHFPFFLCVYLLQVWLLLCVPLWRGGRGSTPLGEHVVTCSTLVLFGVVQLYETMCFWSWDCWFHGLSST